ncbi:hypothetical protein EDB85DRAFT_1974272, partial [Lactarius pseudohatsudake]
NSQLHVATLSSRHPTTLFPLHVPPSSHVKRVGHATLCRSTIASFPFPHPLLPQHPSWRRLTTSWGLACDQDIPITTHPLRYLTGTYKTCSLGWAPQVLTTLPHASLWPPHPPFTTWESTTAATPSRRTRLVMTPCHDAITTWPQRCAKSHCIDSTQCASPATTSCK